MVQDTAKIADTRSEPFAQNSAENGVKDGVEDEVPNGGRQEQALSIVKKYSLSAVAVGLVPVPAVDMVALSALQLVMVRSLAKLYEVPFVPNVVKSLISSLVGFGAAGLAYPTVVSIVKLVPLVGQLAGSASVAACGSVSTFAVGKVFIRHFEAGGTFLTLDPKKVRDYYKEQYGERKTETLYFRKP